MKTNGLEGTNFLFPFVEYQAIGDGDRDDDNKDHQKVEKVGDNLDGREEFGYFREVDRKGNNKITHAFPRTPEFPL